MHTPWNIKNRKHILSFLQDTTCFPFHLCDIWSFELFRLKTLGFPLLLQRLLNSNRHGNGHPDHGVVACAQEAHHFHVKIHLRWILYWGTTTFWAGSPVIRKTSSTSTGIKWCVFPWWGYSITSIVHETRCFDLIKHRIASFSYLYHLLTSFYHPATSRSRKTSRIILFFLWTYPIILDRFLCIIRP